MEKRPADGRQADATCGESWSFAADARRRPSKLAIQGLLSANRPSSP